MSHCIKSLRIRWTCASTTSAGSRAGGTIEHGCPWNGEAVRNCRFAGRGAQAKFPCAGGGEKKEKEEGRGRCLFSINDACLWYERMYCGTRSDELTKRSDASLPADPAYSAFARAP